MSADRKIPSLIQSVFLSEGAGSSFAVSAHD